MKHIRNVELYWSRLAEVIRLRAKAVRQHKKHKDLEREATMIRTWIINYELRHER